MNNPMTYIQNGDYLIPDLKLSQQPEKPLGKYGRMRKTYLKEHHPILYNQMLLSEKLYPHLIEIDETAQNTMPTKAELYAQMAEKVATQLTGSWQEWAGFLTTAARLYKYPFYEQLMIYAQRPDATACAEYDLWTEKMGRDVRRGSKGIALVDDSGDRPSLRYVFDISDTGTREHSRTPWLWQLEERHLDSVQAMLEHTYDVSGDDLAGQLTEVAGKLAEE